MKRCKSLFVTFSFFMTFFGVSKTIHSTGFGVWSIDIELFDYIRNILPPGKIILELGSGWATGQLSKFYTVYSIEHDKKWVNKYTSHYIYAPIKDGWYDVDALKKELPESYDLILVDGPPASIGRGKFYTNLELFKTDVPIIFDDVDRKEEYDLMIKTSEILNRRYQIVKGESGKQFAILLYP